MSKPNLSLVDLLRFGRTLESSKRHAKVMEEKLSKPAQVNKLSKPKQSVSSKSKQNQKGQEFFPQGRNLQNSHPENLQKPVITVVATGHILKANAAQPMERSVPNVANKIILQLCVPRSQSMLFLMTEMKVKMNMKLCSM